MNLKFIANEEKYYEFIRLLRNSNHGDGFVEKVNITPEQQKEYMKIYKECYYVCLDENIPVGFIGQIDDDIRVAVIPDYFKKGVGKFMVNELSNKHPTAYAKVKIENNASLKLFESCGFEKQFYILRKKHD